MRITDDQCVDYVRKIHALFDEPNAPREIDDAAEFVAGKHTPVFMSAVFGTDDIGITEQIKKLWLTKGADSFMYCCGTPIIGFDWCTKESMAPFSEVFKLFGVGE